MGGLSWLVMIAMAGMIAACVLSFLATDGDLLWPSKPKPTSKLDALDTAPRRKRWSPFGERGRDRR